MEWVLYLPRGTLDVFLVIWQPFIKFAAIGGIGGINILCSQTHGSNLCILSDGCHFQFYQNRNLLQRLVLCSPKNKDKEMKPEMNTDTNSRIAIDQTE